MAGEGETQRGEETKSYGNGKFFILLFSQNFIQHFGKQVNASRTEEKVKKPVKKRRQYSGEDPMANNPLLLKVIQSIIIDLN